ncbi:hypothetical protein OROGR_004877 [Orobanche gracilis]
MVERHYKAMCSGKLDKRLMVFLAKLNKISNDRRRTRPLRDCFDFGE